ncbi:HEPN domain-containing protein [Mammaliicoccus sciuri]|uniref:ApeA N-terminal domain 1-containing protein n=1 Tax=Mammaliicoccus sciuri TaxID=1296 RepID=UPI001299D1B0|nr:HEPN domain-containing protein [Mammaliicoccus sciuri]MRE73128.1 hypothetical protein [Mammaliicoccus sciuri]
MKVAFSATGFWKINNKGEELNGDLYLNEEKGGIVLYIRIPNKGPMMSYLEFPLEISFITGSTINGAKMTIVNCSRISTTSRIGSEEVYGYSADFMFNGVNFNDNEDIIFSKMAISIPNIIQWGDTSNYVRPELKTNPTSLIDLNIVEPIEIYSNKNYSIFYYLNFSHPFELMKEEIVLKQIPHLIIEVQTAKPIEWFIEVSNQMKRLIEIAIGSPLSYGTMVVETPKFYYEYDNGEKHSRPLKVIHRYKHTVHNENSTKRLTKHDYLFSLSELNKGNFSQWQEVSDKMEPIIELYIDSLYNQNLSISRHFLNMVQALETYHSRRIAFSLKDYKKRVEKLLKLRPEAYREKDRKFLLNGCKKFITLRSRIADLILADYDFYFYTGDFELQKFPRLIADTRNYYTHYNPKQKDKVLKGEELGDAFHMLRSILEFYLLHELGFEEDFIHERIEERITSIANNISLKNADRKNNQ